MFVLLWIFIFFLTAAVIFLIWMQFKNQGEQLADLAKVQHLEAKVDHLEDHLKRSLELMQELAKKMHVQQEQLDDSLNKMHQIDAQNVELIHLMGKITQSTHDTKTQP